MKRGLALFVVLILSTAVAAVEPTTTTFEVAPGDVVAIPLHVTGLGEVSIDAPKGFLALGVTPPRARDGTALATLLVQTDTLAGTYTVLLRQAGATGPSGSATVTVTVTKVAGLDLRVSGPSTITAGSTAGYQIVATNTGNSSDTYALTVVSLDVTSIDADNVRIAPGKSVTLHLSIDPLGFGERGTHILARSTVDGSYQKLVLIDYTVLALGASNPNAPFLSYVLPLGASYGSSGLNYRAGLSLSGDLSSIISTRDSLALLPEGQRASLGLFGDAWGVTYGYDSRTGHDLTVDEGPWTARGSLSEAGRVTTGLSYWDGSWGVSYAHTWGPEATDQLTSSAAFSVSPAVLLTGSLGVRGEVWPNASYHVSPLVGGTLTWNGPVLIVNASTTLAPWSRRPWQGSLSAYTRTSDPVGLSGSLNVDSDSYSVRLSAREKPTDALTLAQNASYLSTGQLDGRLGLALSVPNSPADVLAVGNAHWSSGGLRGDMTVTTNITQLPWLAAASVSIGPGFTVSYGQTYVGPDYSLGASVALPLGGGLVPVFGVQGAYAPNGVSLGAALSFDTGSATLGASGSLGIQVLPQLGLQGSVGYDPTEGITWQIGAQAAVTGGVAVPEPVVNAFGGLDVGTVTGVVTAKGPTGVRPLAGIEVSIPKLDQVTSTDASGRFRLTVKPGSYQLGFPDLAPQYSPPETVNVVVRRQTTVRQDVAMTVSYAITGQVFIDRQRSGSAAGSSEGLAYAKVRLQDASGATTTTTTGDNGDFVFRNLEPGTFTVSIVGDSLPPSYEPSRGTVEVTLGAEKLPFVSLGVAPIRPTVTNTLNGKNLSLTATADPAEVPAGALATVHAEAPRASAVTVQVGGGPSVELQRQGDGSFRGDVTVPADTGAVALLHVTATAATASAEQTVMVFVTHGPLASIILSPGYAQTGEKVDIRAHFLYHPGRVTVQLPGSVLDLKQTAPLDFEGTVTAPSTVGSVQVVLYDGSKKVAHAMLDVRHADASTP